MAKKSEVEVEPTIEKAPVEPVQAARADAFANLSVYTAEELAANHKAFKASKAVVAVALKIAGKETATFEEAKTIVEAFKNKEV